MQLYSRKTHVTICMEVTGGNPGAIGTQRAIYSICIIYRNTYICTYHIYTYRETEELSQTQHYADCLNYPQPAYSRFTAQNHPCISSRTAIRKHTCICIIAICDIHVLTLF